MRQELEFSSLFIWMIFCISVSSQNKTSGLPNARPQQIHISCTGDISSMFVTWTSLGMEGDGYVHYRKEGSTHIHTIRAHKTALIHTNRFDPISSNGTARDNGRHERVTYVFKAAMHHLEPSTRYVYKVQTWVHQSDEFAFRSFASSADFKPRIAIFGDLGTHQNTSMPSLINMTNKNQLDMVIHNGDIAYDLDHNFGHNGDAFMNLIQPIATKIPYNFGPGNHESYNNFSEFRGRFSSPGPSVFYHSFDVGPIHFIIYTTEIYIFKEYGTSQIESQYNWLAYDLANANKPKNRKQRPWIVVLGHRPMYCSNKNDPDCERNNILRTGIDRKLNLEELFYKHHVDVILCGHKHDYERLFPMYKYMHQKMKDPNFYLNPKFPVQVISGSAGLKEKLPFTEPKPDWSAVRNTDRGFTIVRVVDRATLELKQFSAEKNIFVDKFVIHKSKFEHLIDDFRTRTSISGLRMANTFQRKTSSSNYDIKSHILFTPVLRTLF